MSKKIKNQRGSALLLTLAIMALLTLAALTAVDTATTNMDLSFNYIHADQALYIAEAGYQRAHATKDADSTWRAGFDTTAFGDGKYWVIVVDSIADTMLADTFLIFSFAIVEEAKAAIKATLVLEQWHPFQWGLWGNGSVIIENAVTTDSYNSDSGSFAATYDAGYGSIGSNGIITISNNPTIGGDVMTSTPGGLNISGGTILGDTSSTAPSQDFSKLVDASDFTWAEANSLAPGGD